jgi:ABC-type sugar transport system substrate-binding protein
MTNRKKYVRISAIILLLVLLLTAITACDGTETEAEETTGAEVDEGEDEEEVVAETTEEAAGEDTGDEAVVVSDKEPFDEFPRPRIVTDRPLKVAFITHPSEAESRERTLKQNQIEAAHRGWELTVITVEDATEYKDAMLTAISLDVDAIHLGNLNSMESLVDVIAQARNAGIGVYNDDNQVVAGIIGNSTMPNAVASTALLYKVGEDYQWNANVCYPSIPVMQVHNERLLAVLGTADAYPSWNTLEVVDVTTWPGGIEASLFEIPTGWMDKYGDELTGIYCTADVICMSAAEAIMSRGLTGDDIWVAAIDGGSDAFAYIRNETPFMYVYAQPFEAYAHFTNEIIADIQVKGLNPGDPGCIISQVGEAIYSEGVIVTRDNCPPVGVSIHTIYDYYDPDAGEDVWYKWPEEGGPYIISEGGVTE